MKDPRGRYAQLNSSFCGAQVGYSTPPVLQSYHYSPMYSYTSPCSKTNYYSSCGSCPKQLSVSDAYTNQPINLQQSQGCGCNNQQPLYNNIENVSCTNRQPVYNNIEGLSLSGSLKGKCNTALRKDCGCKY